MIVLSYLGAPSNRGLDQRLYGLSGVENVPGGLWVVLELEWSSRTPPTEFFRDHLTSPQPHPLIFLYFLAYAAASFSSISVFPFFLAVVTVALPIFLFYFICYE